MSFGLTAKERMAQLQAKNAKDTPPPKAAPGNALKKPGNGPAKPAADAPKPGDAKKPETKEPPKPELKKPDAAKPGPGDAGKPQAAKKDEPAEAKKPEPAKPKEEPKKPEAKEPAKPAEEAKKTEPTKPKEEAKPKDEPKKPEPAKPKEEPPKPEVKPKEEAKAPEPAKPKDEPKKPEAKPAEPPKPTEQQKAPEPAKTEAKPTEAKPAEAKPAAAPPATKEPEKPKEEAKPAAPAKPKEEPPKPAEAKPPTDKPKVDEQKPAEPPKPATTEPAKPAATEPAKPAADKPAAEEAKKTEPAPVKAAPPPKTDMIGSIFYFSGMGSLLGSALAEGVYVPESGQRSAIDSDAIESATARRRAMNKTEQVVTTARNQAQALSTDFRNLQALLESVPTFGEPLQAQPLERRGVDQPIHGHVYFRQSDHMPLQAPPSKHGSTHAVPEVSHDAHISATYTTTVQRFPGAKQVLPAHPHQPAEVQQQPPPQATPYSDQSAIQPHHEPHPPSQWAQQPSRSPHFDQQPAQIAHHPPVQHDRPTLSHADYGLEAPSQPWQDRYGRGSGHATDAARSPRPFGADRGDVDAGGIKPWQLSHVRGLEAKGYHLVAEPQHDVDADSSSYAPYLVSDRTFNVDRQKTFRRGIEEHLPTAPSPYGVHQPAFRPPSAGATYPFAPPATDSTMPYCDL